MLPRILFPILLLPFLTVEAATLSGTVVDAVDGVTPVHPVQVTLLDPSTGDFTVFSIGNQPNGSWQMFDVPPGDYRVLFIAGGTAEAYLDELYPDAWCDNTGCDRAGLGGTFTVLAGANQLDNELNRGYLISGVITDDQGNPLEGVYVDVFNDEGGYICCANASDATGAWDHPVAVLDTYHAVVPFWTVTRYVPQAWNGHPCDDCDVAGTGEPIVVAGDVTGIDFSLFYPEGIGPADSLLDDGFSEDSLNSCRWLPLSIAAESKIQVGDALHVSSNEGGPFQPGVVGVNGIDGNFSITVRMVPGAGWDDLPSGYHAPGISAGPSPFERLGIAVHRYAGGSLELQVYTTAPQDVYNLVGSQGVAGFADGYLRLSRIGSTWIAESRTDGPWQQVAEVEWVSDMVYPVISVDQADTTHPLTVTFDEFTVTGGTLRAANRHSRLSRFLPRSDLMVGGVFENHVFQRAYGGSWIDPLPTDLLAAAGMNWARVGLTNYYAPELVGLPTSEWPPLHPDGLYWAANETRIQMLKDARDSGMQLIAFYYLSGRYGEWVGNISQANAPQGWEALTLEQTLVEVQQFSAELTQRLVDEGLDIEIYEIGNETDWGLAGFDPRDKVVMPYPTDWRYDVPAVRDNLWAPQAEIHKAAIAGIRSVDPDAKFSLHPTGIVHLPATYFAKAYFKYMMDQGVEFDFAALSWPYPYAGDEGSWDLNRYSVPCWFYSIEELTAWLNAMGKPAYIAEGSYPAAATPFAVSPVEGMPFDETGQAEWLSTMLNFVSNNLNMLGFFYFYPEWFPGMGGPGSEEIEAYGLFNNDSGAAPRQSLASLNANLQAPVEVTTDLSGIWAEPGQAGEEWAVEILQLETEGQLGQARITWCSNQGEGGSNQRIQFTAAISGNRISFRDAGPLGDILFTDGFEPLSGVPADLNVEIAFRNPTEAMFTWNGNGAWDSGRFEIERSGPLGAPLICD